jgi:16S rRNA (cytidine1402-2'-O)-methyltransferase
LGTLYVVATPIGNLEDLSPRAVRVLRDVALIAAEDTRHSRRLLTHFAIDTPTVSYHEHNQRARRHLLLEALKSGDVALITDAGTPAISDPGADLVTTALAAGHRVSPIPGASAVAAAVSASGLVEGPFLTLGFLPRERGERLPLVARAATTGFPLVLFESAQRLGRTLQDLVEILGDRPVVMSRELTKIHEEVRASSLSALRDWAADSEPRGEIALVIAAAPEAATSESDAEAVVRTLRESGLSASQTAREAAGITGLPRSELYKLAMSVDVPGSVRLKGQLALPDQDALQDSLGDQEGPQGWESRTDERQRDASNRHEADVHSDIHESLEEEHSRYANSQWLAKSVPCNHRNMETSPQQNREHEHQGQHADKAEHAAGVREDEVGFADFE